MDLVYVTEGRFVKDPEGNFFSSDGSHSYRYWKKYRTIYDNIYIIGRVLPTHSPQEKEDAIGNRVIMLPLSGYIGVFGYLKNFILLKRQLSRYLSPQADRAYILKVPGIIGALSASICRRRNIKYGVEVVGDPYEVFAPRAVNHFLRPFLRKTFTKQLKDVVKYSSAALFVTKLQLQKRYPCGVGVFNTYASDVILEEEAFANDPKTHEKKEIVNLISIGSLEQMYKAPDIVLMALKELILSGIKCHLTWLGDGKFRKEIEQQADKLKIRPYVFFPGKIVSGNGVREYLDRSDIFILASRTEGLPRALVEAMARGLPCIGTQVGGIPELLDEQALVPKDDAISLANKIKFFIENSDFANQQAIKNLQESKSYTSAILEKRRLEFYKTLSDVSKMNGLS